MKVLLSAGALAAGLLTLVPQGGCKRRGFNAEPFSDVRDESRSLVAAIAKETGSGRKFRVGQAERLVAEIGRLHRDNLGTSGFRTIEAFKKAMMDFDGTSRTVMKHLESNDFDIAIHARSEFRESIAKNGYLSSRQVKHEQVNSEPDRLDVIENRLSFKDPAYLDLDPYVKPKYGLLRSGTKSPEILPLVTSYGDDVWILRKPNVAARTTWLAGDSFSFKGTTASWEDMFAPWNTIVMATPFLRSASVTYKKITELVIGGPAKVVNRKVLGVLDVSPPPEGMRFRSVDGEEETLKVGQKIARNAFLELQIWGPIDLQDVERFEFTETPPSSDFASEMTNAGVEIYDGRAWPPAVWKPGRIE